MAERPIETINPSNVADAIREKAGVGFSEPTFESWRYNAPTAEGAMVFPKSRRKMRMEAEFQEYQKQQLEQQGLVQQMEIQRMQEERLQRAQNFDLENAKIAEEREARVINEAGAMIDSIRGAVAPDGTIISNPIRPEDPDAIDRLDNLARDFKFGIENKAAAGMFTQLYNDALKFREERIKESKQNELDAVNLSVRTGKPFEQFGSYDERGMFQPKMQGMIAGAEEVKAAESAQEEERSIEKERRGERARAEVRTESNIVSEEKRIRGDIRKAKEEFRKLNASFAGKKSLSATQQANLKAAKDTILDLEIEKADLRGLVFDTEQEAEAAKPPSGSIIYIGRKPNKVP